MLHFAFRVDDGINYDLLSSVSRQQVRGPHRCLLLESERRQEVLQGDPGCVQDRILQWPRRGRIICGVGRIQVNREYNFVVKNTKVSHAPAAISG